MIVAVTERQTWKRCRRRWQLSSETQGNLELGTFVPALQLGTMVQECLSHWQEHPETDPVRTFAQISQISIDKYKQSYEERVGTVVSEEELDPMYDLIKLGLAMTTNYKIHYGKPLPKDFKIIQTEQRIMVAIPDTLHFECDAGHMIPVEKTTPLYTGQLFPKTEGLYTDYHSYHWPECEHLPTGRSHYLRGTLDSLLQDTKGKVYPLERKTYGQRPEPTKLTHDDQMLAYLWILTQLFGVENVGGVLYDGLWKRAEPPKKRGNAAQLELKDLFYRDIFPRPPEEIAEFGRFLKDEVEDMAEGIIKNRMFINRTWQGCWDCGMAKLCAAMSKGEDVEYVKSTFYRQRQYGTILPEEDD